MSVYYLPTRPPDDPVPSTSEWPSLAVRLRNAWWRLRLAIIEMRGILRSQPRYVLPANQYDLFSEAPPPPRPASSGPRHRLRGGAPAAPSGGAARSEAGVSQPRILVVDDEVDVQAVVGDLLTEDGYDVDTVGTPNAAITPWTGAPTMPFICDIRLPGCRGDALAAEMVRRRPRLANRIILMTGESCRSARDAARGSPSPLASTRS